MMLPTAGPLDQEELKNIDHYWRAANYLSVGQIYLRDNALLREPLKLEHTKPRVARTLWYYTWAELYLCAYESRDQEE